MADTSARAMLRSETAIADFVATLNEGSGTLTEIAFAKPGTSQFNRAIYYEQICEAEINRLSAGKVNVSFCGGLSKEAMQPLALGSESSRKGADRFVNEKRIVSFDLDFKSNVTDYKIEQREALISNFGEQIKTALPKSNIQPWMTIFSGNGLHLHFKLKIPYRIESLQRYKQVYDSVRSYLECLTDLKFDRACSNPSRLMRLPFSTNWKTTNDPVQCRVLQHDADSDFSSVFGGFSSMAAFEYKTERKFVKDKHVILATLSLERVLEHFQYSKMATIQQRNGQSVCSSPFTQDFDPSFYYDSQRKLFYDFSSGFGGDIFTLIGRLANLNTKTEFGKVLHLAAKIGGVQLSKTESGGFRVDEKGVWYQGGSDGEPIWLSSPIFVEALTRDASSQAWGRLLTLKDQDSVRKQWSMPMELLAGDGSEVRRALLNLGAEMAVGKRERQLFLSFLQSSRPSKRAHCVNRVGWHSNKYVLPDHVFEQAGDASSIMLQTLTPDTSICVQGSLEDWQRNVGDLCIGNSRLVFAVSVAFASALLKSSGDENGGFHLVGPSSIGKSITLKVAASIWGNPGINGFIKRWRSTLNGLEAVAASRCDSLLILDELGEVTAKDAGTAAYMLSGGMSKNRATKNSTTANSLEWRLLFLSSGEISLGQHISQGGFQVNAGQEIRMLEISAECPGSSGIFENIYSFASASSFAVALANGSESCFGTPIRHFLGKAVSNPSLYKTLNEKRREFLSIVSTKGNHCQIQRALNRFALVAAAGELAIELGTLTWDQGEAFSAARRCFEDWFQAWGVGGSREGRQLAQQIKTLLQEFGPSRFPILQEFKKNADDHHQQLWGFRKESTENKYEWIVLSEVFRTQLCKGYDLRRATRDLRDAGLLQGGSSPMRLPHLGVTRVFRLNPEIVSM